MAQYIALDVYGYYNGPTCFTVQSDRGIYLLRYIGDTDYGRVFSDDAKEVTAQESEIDFTKAEY